MTRKARPLGLLVWTAFAVAVASPCATAAVSIYLSPERLAERAVVVVEAVVTDVRPGLDPADGGLHTYVTLDVQRTLRGPALLDTVVVREAGGRWGEIVHELDAVPVYRSGERVIAFLEPAADGALRTSGMFFGRFEIDGRTPRGPREALRDLEGQGTIHGAVERRERIPVRDLVALTATVPPTATTRAWSPRPPEWGRLLWEPRADDAPSPAEAEGDDGSLRLERREPTSGVDARFVALSSASPARWYQVDSGSTVAVHVEPGGNPLADDAAAVHEIGRALDAWSDVPQSRLRLVLGDPDYDYTSRHASPTGNYSGVNVVLFDDPYDDISDPSGCGGVLAVGGYWRSGSTGVTVNNVSFHPSLQLYVIFNNDFECFLGVGDNLAEVAAHEIGHGIGFGHSNENDAIMRASAYGYRGPLLGADDVDAAHCHYPHTLTVVRPNGGESFVVGALETIEWSATAESGPDTGTVDLEYSTDGGSVWQTIAAGVPNDGTHTWSVPAEIGETARVRVVRPPAGATPSAPYPSACSADASDADFSITQAPPLAGAVDASAPGGGLRLARGGGGAIELSWSASCSAEAGDYALYEGDLAALRAGTWKPEPLTCSAGTDLVESIAPAAGLRYYLVAPTAGNLEGSLGSDGAGRPRPASPSACAPRETTECGG